MAKAYNAQALPLTFGAWVVISEQINGPITYSISAQPLAPTKVIGEVRYWGESGELRTDTFLETIQITTENSTQQVKVRFKNTLPTLVAVRVMVTSVLH